MLDEFEVVSVPLMKNTQGVIQVVGTRVSLDSIMQAYYEGATAEEITLRFPSCRLEKIYTILSWALNHVDEVSHYLTSQEKKRQKLEDEIRRTSTAPSIRERLIARSQNSK